MNKDGIKQYLFDNKEMIQSVLEELGCHNIRMTNKMFVCSQPNGDNKGAINVYLNEGLSVKHRTRNDFESKYEVSDIFSLVQYINGIDFVSAIKFVANVCGVKYNSNYNTDQEISESYNILKQFKKKKKSKKQIVETVISYKTEDRFVIGDCVQFLDDRINSEAQEKFEVAFDVLDNRIVFPIKNDAGEIVSFKGRSVDKDYKIKGIPKYLYYYPIEGRNYLYGFFENYFDMLLADDVIVFESEKSVQQCYSMGIRNTVATSKKVISDEQVKKLLKLGKNITIAFDNDVAIEEIYTECAKFKGLCDVFYIQDVNKLLEEKDSPTDKGRDVFLELYGSKIKYKGELNEI